MKTGCLKQKENINNTHKLLPITFFPFPKTQDLTKYSLSAIITANYKRHRLDTPIAVTNGRSINKFLSYILPLKFFNVT